MSSHQERGFFAIRQGEWFAVLRVLFGVVWAFNFYFQLHPAYIDSVLSSLHAAAKGQAPAFAAYINGVASFVQFVGARGFAYFTAAVSGLLALSLITGVALRAFSWVGIVYSLFMWTTLEAVGAPYGPGTTDPGEGIVYAISFVLILTSRAWENANILERRRAAPETIEERQMPDRYAVGRILFGLLWAFDAFWKWHPDFLANFTSFFTSELTEQHAAWVVAWVHFVVSVIRFIGPTFVAVISALVETALAVSLITGLFMAYVLPVGVVFTFVLWATAEQFGGPFTEGIDADPTAFVGAAIIYTGAFLYLMAMYRPYASWRTRRTRRSARLDSPHETAGD